MNKRFSLLYPEGCNEGNGMSQFDFIEELFINTLMVPATQNILPWERTRLEISKFITTDIEVIMYRLDIIEDLLNNPNLYEAFKEVLPYIKNIQDLRAGKDTATDVTSCLYSISEIELYIEAIDLFKNAIESSDKIKSKGLCQFVEILKNIYEREDYKILKSESQSIASNVRNIKSITIGVNLDAQLRPTEAGVLSINDKVFRSGNIIDRILRMDMEDDGYRCITPLTPYGKSTADRNVTAYNLAFNNALDIIFKSSVKSWQPVIRRYMADNALVLVDLMDDIRFLIGGVELIKSMEELNLPMCKPVVRPMNEKAFSLTGLYNPYIARRVKETTGRRIILNDFQFDKDGMIYIFTGPNQGGKSVTTYAVGIAQALMQLGLYVPAESAVISPVDNIFTNFPAKEESTVNKGRLGEECSRLSEMLDIITEHSLVLMDETLSSTSAIEATYIAAEVIVGLSLIGCRCIFATHLHDLSQMVDELNEKSPNGSRIDNLVAQLDDRDNNTRSYKILRTKPDGLSYAKNIAEQYGITLDRIKERIEKSS